MLMLIVEMLLTVTLTQRQLVVDDDTVRSRVVGAKLGQQTIGRLTAHAQLATPSEHRQHFNTSFFSIFIYLS